MIKLILTYLAAIVAANLLITWLGAPAAPWVALGLIGLDLTVRDQLHESWAGRHLWPKMLALILGGSLLSWIINPAAGKIGLASAAAFLAAGLADFLVYSLLIQRSKLIKINGSNLVSAAVDSLVFPQLAFGSFLPWVVLAQFAAKSLGGFLWSLILVPSTRQQIRYLFARKQTRQTIIWDLQAKLPTIKMQYHLDSPNRIRIWAAPGLSGQISIVDGVVNVADSGAGFYLVDLDPKMDQSQILDSIIQVSLQVHQ